MLAVLLLEDVLLSGGKELQALGGGAGGPVRPVKTVQEIAGDAVLFEHHGDGLGGVEGGIAFATTFGVVAKSALELISQAEVIDHQAAGLVTKDTVDAGDRLHQAVALHRFVGIHGVQTGRIEAGEPHISHDHDLEGIGGNFEADGQLATRLLAADVGLPVGAVVGAAGHHHLEDVLRPLGPQLDQGVVEVDADAAAHADDHRLAVHRLEAFFKVRHQVGGHERDALGITHQRFEGSPLCFQLFLGGLLLAFGDLLKLLIEPGQLSGIEGEFGDAALVVDRHGGLIGHGALNVVDGDVLTEHGPGVGVDLFDRRAGEADEGGVGEGITQVAGEAVGHHAGLIVNLAAEAVLAAVRFIGDHHDVGAGAQLGHRFALFRHEFLDGGEHHATTGPIEQLAQVFAIGGLQRRLAEEIGATLELAKELVVEVVAIGEHHQGGVLHHRMAHDAGGIEEHREALAAALGVPHHAGTAVARLAAQGTDSRAQAAGAHGFLHRGVDGVELVVAGDDLVQGA